MRYVTLRLYPNNIVKMLRILKESLGVYAGWTILHWTFTNVYAHMCAPFGGWGLFQTFFLTQSTYCTAIRSASYISGATMDQSLSAALTWCLVRLSYHNTTRLVGKQET